MFLVAAELARQGFTVSLTSRSAKGADLLVTDHACSHAYSVEVKTNGAPANFWLLNKGAQSISSPSHYYVLVNLDEDLNAVEYYVVPSVFVASNVKVEPTSKGTWYSIRKSAQFEHFKNHWDYFRGIAGETTQPVARLCEKFFVTGVSIHTMPSE